ncbi:hypothetical protein [Frankia sp. QA3]|uniref:hypothetical protein n=1 Tax=Frankia sp. QA3 TaxID=710111 RepID=UPI000269CAE4|nr:hypothetical protein [Frankia sp. QA3]EIV93193.1 hypothetical protein FraQA3DRAFT_2873 [Frankia sp. QA3]
MSLTGSESRYSGARRAAPSAVARRNAWVLRVLGLSVGGLAVGVAIGLVVGR